MAFKSEHLPRHRSRYPFVFAEVRWVLLKLDKATSGSVPREDRRPHEEFTVNAMNNVTANVRSSERTRIVFKGRLKRSDSLAMVKQCLLNTRCGDVLLR